MNLGPLPFLVSVSLQAGVLMLTGTGPAVAVALLAGYVATRWYVPVRAPRKRELLALLAVPVALLLWAAFGYASFQGQRSKQWPVVTIYTAMVLQLVLASVLWTRHIRHNTKLAAVPLCAAAYVSGGVWLTTSMALYNVWL